jgi:hypothetical protein
MKFLIAKVVILFTTITTKAQVNEATKYVELENTIYAASIKSIEVLDGIEVVLTNRDHNTIYFTGNQNNILFVRWSVKNGVLELSAPKANLFGKVKVYVCLPSLKNISIYDDASIKTETAIANSVTINVLDNGYAKIASSGKIVVSQYHGIEETWINRK